MKLAHKFSMTIKFIVGKSEEIFREDGKLTLNCLVPFPAHSRVAKLRVYTKTFTTKLSLI